MASGRIDTFVLLTLLFVLGLIPTGVRLHPRHLLPGKQNERRAAIT
jgi:hypothetical protein